MENLEKTYLEPMEGTQKSFYGKAKILTDSEGNKYLQSYDSIIAEIKEGKAKIHTDVYLWDSKTSLKHLRSFFKNYNMPIGSKKQLIEMYA